MNQTSVKENKRIKGIINSKEVVYNLFVSSFIFLQIQFLYESAPGMLRWNKETITFLWPSFVIILFIGFAFFKALKIKSRSFVFILYIIISFSVTIMVNKDIYLENIFFISSIICGFIASNLFKKDDYLKGYVRVMTIYSLYSLIATYILLPVYLKGNLGFFNTYTSLLGRQFIDMGLSYSVAWHGLMRNQGIFREPGVFQFFILVSLVVEMFYLNQKKINFRIIILTITMISTFSTIGLTCLCLLLISYLITNKNNYLMRNGLLIVCIYFILFVLAKSNDDIIVRLNSSLSKLNGDVNNVSSRVRYESIFNLIKMSLHNPLFGSSFVNGFNYIINNYNEFGTRDITGTLFSYIMALGYPVGILINIYFYNFCSLICNSKNITLFVFFLLFLSLNSQNLVYSSVIWTFLFMPLNESKT